MGQEGFNLVFDNYHNICIGQRLPYFHKQDNQFLYIFFDDIVFDSTFCTILIVLGLEFFYMLYKHSYRQKELIRISSSHAPVELQMLRRSKH